MAPARAEAGGEGLGLQKSGAWLGPKRGAQRARRGHATHPWNRWAAGRAGGEGRSLGQRPPWLAVQTDSGPARPASRHFR